MPPSKELLPAPYPQDSLHEGSGSQISTSAQFPEIETEIASILEHWNTKFLCLRTTGQSFFATVTPKHTA